MVSSRRADSSPSEEDAFRQILTWHTTRYSKLEIQDLYKLVYQAAFGSEHAIADVSQARAWLECEIEGLAESPEEQVIEPISPDGHIVRVNLRPYVTGGDNLEILLEAFIRTAKEHKGAEGQLRRYWRYAERMAKEGILGLAVNELRSFFEELEARGFPAVHHSDEYRETYRPAYRVVVREYVLFEGERNNKEVSI